MYCDDRPADLPSTGSRWQLVRQGRKSTPSFQSEGYAHSKRVGKLSPGHVDGSFADAMFAGMQQLCTTLNSPNSRLRVIDFTTKTVSTLATSISGPFALSFDRLRNRIVFVEFYAHKISVLNMDGTKEILIEPSSGFRLPNGLHHVITSTTFSTLENTNASTFRY